MEALELLVTQSVINGGKNARQVSSPGPSTWLEHSLNDTDCFQIPETSDCLANDSWTLNNSSQVMNATSTVLPPSLGFDDNAMTDIIIYSVMFLVAAVGNLTVFITLFRNRHRKSRVNMMIMHLAAADLMVTLINFPLEVGWRITTQWVAGNLACKLFQFLRAFGLYLSSLVLVCISLDRYFAIVHPLKVNDAQRRGKMMLTFAWSIAAVCSLPQSVIFHVDTHPVFQDFKQCVTFGFFRTQVEEMTYNLFCLAAMYFMPLLVIIVVYLRILWEISQKSKDSNVEPSGQGRGGRMRLRRSDVSNIERARARTLRMTVIIVLAFIWCWTPYVVIVMWYMFDRESAEQVDKRLQDALFIMAVSNSCVNPLVYGTYTINFRNELNRCFGRKTKPAVLARKSTACDLVTRREISLYLNRVFWDILFQQVFLTLLPRRLLLFHHTAKLLSRSTALRTTVTAHRTSGTGLKMSTQIKVVERRGSASPGAAAGDGSPTHAPKLAIPTPTTSETPRGFSLRGQAAAAAPPPVVTAASAATAAAAAAPAAAPAAAAAAAASPPAPSMASGCVVVEIEEDEERRPSEGSVTPSTTKSTSTSENKLLLYSRISETQDKVTDSVTLTSILPLSNEKQQERRTCLKQMACKKAQTSPITHVKFSNLKESVLGRKLSTHSGFFFESRHRRLKHNSLINSVSDQSETMNNLAQGTSIELKSIRPLNNVI